MTRRTDPHRLMASIVLLVVGSVALGACSGISAIASVAASAAPGDSAGDADAPDPCALLTTADVQPFFTIPIVTQLPGPKIVGNTCEWAANDAPGGVSTSLDLNMTAGQDATFRWQVLSTTGGGVMFSGVGDQAEHTPGTTDLLAIKGDVLCNLTTVGWTHLVGKKDYEPGTMPDAAATSIAQQYGTLCNKIFGSGQTTPTLVAPPVTGAAGSTAPASAAASIAIPAVGGTFGAGFPLPVGVDCSGSATTTDLDGSSECATMTSSDPKAIYPFYLATLPADGYTINQEHEGTAGDGTEIASIVFEGNGAGGFSSINVQNLRVTITLRKPN